MTYQECNRAIRAARREAERHRKQAAGRESAVGAAAERTLADYWTREAERLEKVRRSYGRGGRP